MPELRRCLPCCHSSSQPSFVDCTCKIFRAGVAYPSTVCSGRAPLPSAPSNIDRYIRIISCVPAYLPFFEYNDQIRCFLPKVQFQVCPLSAPTNLWAFWKELCGDFMSSFCDSSSTNELVSRGVNVSFVSSTSLCRPAPLSRERARFVIESVFFVASLGLRDVSSCGTIDHWILWHSIGHV